MRLSPHWTAGTSPASLGLPMRSLATLLLLLLGCSGGAPKGDPAGAPTRLVTLGPTLTELVWALGAGDRLVGRSRWDTWPADVREVPDLGDAIRPNIERIVAARPDLVVLYPAGDNAPAIATLEGMGVRTLALRVDRIEDFLAAVDTLGHVLGARDRADSIVRAVQAALDSVRGLPALTPRPRVFVPAWLTPPITVGAGSFLSELIEIAGGTNVYADRAEPSFQVSFEDVVRRAPDLVLSSDETRGRLETTAPWSALGAVREGRIVPFDTLTMSQPSTRLGVAARTLANALRASVP